ncbi:hypothetical protein [Paenibacillus sp. NPDC093718]|uniref:hypothetical protein n=1 Tax=Paenibacillus sp. NPDC093718 TaxID=3390601 RepID=UPI003CFD93E2
MDNQEPKTHKQFAMDCFNQVWDILENIVGSSVSLEPFYIGYGYEAEARAYLLLGNKEQALLSKEKATRYLDKVTDKESHQMLANDLKNL